MRTVRLQNCPNRYQRGNTQEWTRSRRDGHCKNGMCRMLEARYFQPHALHSISATDTNLYLIGVEGYSKQSFEKFLTLNVCSQLEMRWDGLAIG